MGASRPQTPRCFLVLDYLFSSTRKLQFYVELAPYYDHVMEGADDMPAHAKSSLFGVSVNIPITNGRLNLGTWQGIYLCEFRDYGGERRIVATLME